MNRRQTSSAPISDAAMLAVIGAAVAICGVVWLWGGLAGAIFGRGWPDTGGTALLGVLERLPTSLDDPAAAWPTAVRSRLPGAGGFYITLAALFCLSTGVVVLARRGGRLAALGYGREGARWAGGAELQALRRGRGRSGQG